VGLCLVEHGLEWTGKDLIGGVRTMRLRSQVLVPFLLLGLGALSLLCAWLSYRRGAAEVDVLVCSVIGVTFLLSAIFEWVLNRK
jgi:hypothetical protein